jgi:hypothetical protein
MRRLFHATVLTLLTAALLPIAGVGSAEAASRYKAYVACGLTAAADPSHSCDASDDKAAFFKSRDAHVHYKVCVKFPNATRLCAAKQDAPKGKLRHNEITSTQTGRHKVTWFVGGDLVKTWFFDVV